ncbi:MAG: HEAT repeat domain-containing protein [Planctomycetes bacterium]|nr:HEAT repeat domain-containing protein [Planctomycetota bacterium]
MHIHRYATRLSRPAAIIACSIGLAVSLSGCAGGRGGGGGGSGGGPSAKSGSGMTGRAFVPDSASIAILADPVAVEALRAEALQYLQEMTADPYPGYRANAIEALADVPEVGEQVARTGLSDENPAVRYASAMVIGRRLYASSAPLVNALVRDVDPSVRLASLYAMKRNGYRVDLTPLADALRSSPDARVRANAAYILGELGDPTAITLLRDALTYDVPKSTVADIRIYQLQVAEALVKLGDHNSLSRLRAPLYTRDPADGEIAAFAAAILGRVGDRSSIPDLVKIVAMWKEYRYSAEIRLAAMGSLAQLGQPPDPEMIAEYLGPEFQADEANVWVRGVRSQATYVLGLIESSEVVLPYLVGLYRTDGDDLVRIPAAAGLLNHLPASP